MSAKLPDRLATYFFAQNAHDVEAMIACFAPDAEVRDEGHVHGGAEVVREWKKDTVPKYGVSVEPLDISESDGLTIVSARVAGNFSGSPANLTYSFGLSTDGLIRTLAIR